MNGKDDPFYRYTMPRLIIKVEGSTKMIKTGLERATAASRSSSCRAQCFATSRLWRRVSAALSITSSLFMGRC
jgi:hypothetical protein